MNLKSIQDKNQEKKLSKFYLFKQNTLIQIRAISKPKTQEFGQSDWDVLGLMLKSNKFQLEEPWENFQKTFSVKSYSY